jgi:hypothetical protein
VQKIVLRKLRDLVVLWTNREVLSGDQQGQRGALSLHRPLTRETETISETSKTNSPLTPSIALEDFIIFSIHFHPSCLCNFCSDSYRTSRSSHCASYREVPVSNRSEIAQLMKRLGYGMGNSVTEIRFSAGAFSFSRQSTLAPEPTALFVVMNWPESEANQSPPFNT